MKHILALLIAASLAGCTSTLTKLPAISAKEVSYDRHDPFGGTTITARGVATNADGSLTAEEVEWNTKYPQFSLRVTAKGYTQEAKKP